MFENFSAENNSEDVLMKRLGLIKQSGFNWDKNTFLQSYKELSQELIEVGDRKNDLLMRFYEDAFWLKPGQEYSDYEDRFSMPVPENRYAEKNFAFLHVANYAESLSVNQQSGLTRERNQELMRLAGNEAVFGNCGKVSALGGTDNYYSAEGNLEKKIYGPSQLNHLGAGDFVFLPHADFGSNDVIGSDAFTSCSALIIKSETGLFFAHVTTGTEGLKKLIHACQQIYEGDEFVVVRPEWRENAVVNEAFERDWAFLNEPGISEYRYPYIAMDSDRPAGVNETSILVMKDKIRVVGRGLFPQGKRKFIPDTVQEISY